MIEPDAKDWTWVVERPCPECGFDAAAHDPRATSTRIREVAASFRAALEAPDAVQRFRPDRWSLLEYGCHVRDVLVIYRGRLGRMLTEDDPMYENWDQDATAREADYSAQDPATVATELENAAGALAADFDGVGAGAWSRPGRRSDGATFTVATFSQYLVHDLVHHVWDVAAAPR
ncbi:MAG: DinB family protein [Acidimicrobiia bacterium]